ncbi:MAG: hypothetical protein RLZ57_1021 [Actinomycetota bacterium]
MSQQVVSMSVTSSTKISEILHKFENSSQDLLLIDVDTLIPQPVMELMSDYPMGVSSALVSKNYGGNVELGGGNLVSASSEYHRAEAGTDDFVGLLRLSQKQKPEIVNSLRAIENTKLPGKTIDLVLVGLIRSGLEIKATPVDKRFWIRSSQKTGTEFANVNEGLLRLRLANRSTDGFYSVFFLRKISKLLTWTAVKLRMQPNQITVISFLIGVYAAYLFSLGTTTNYLFGAVLLQVSLIVDCVDGELARYTRNFSDLGAWLDAVTDRVKEYLVFFAMAYGAAKNGQDLWALASFMMIFQTFRHISDYNFARVQKLRQSKLSPLPFEQIGDGRVHRNKKTGRLKFWLRKIINFPIGERWLAISVTVAIGGPKFTFFAMPILSLISITTIFRGRFANMKKWEKTSVGAEIIAPQLDFWKIKTGIFHRANWLEPSLLRAVEGGFLIYLMSQFENAKQIEYLIIFAVMFHHYDVMYRALQGKRKPDWLTALGFTWPIRLLVITLFATKIEWLNIYFLVVFVGLSSLQWMATMVANNRANRIA